MFELESVEHHIQKHIIGGLIHNRYARFRDLRPPRIDTNLYSYHLKLLIKKGYIAKTDEGYTLSDKGFIYVDRVSIQKLNIRSQPKIITMLVVQNSSGDVLLQKRTKQPYIDTWTLPYGKVHIDDSSVLAGARREWNEKVGSEPSQSLSHAGSCYIRVSQGGLPVSSTMAHIFYAADDDIVTGEDLVWARPHKLAQFSLAPAVEQIIARTFFRDPYFFEEYHEELVQ